MNLTFDFDATPGSGSTPATPQPKEVTEPTVASNTVTVPVASPEQAAFLASIVPAAASALCPTKDDARALMTFAEDAVRIGRLENEPRGIAFYKDAARLVNELCGRPASLKPMPTVESCAVATANLSAPPIPTISAEPVIYPDIADRGDWVISDGGLVGTNGSATVGVWAWVRVKDGVEIERRSGSFTAEEIGRPLVSSPIAELMAICKAVKSLPEGWIGTVCSDNKGAIGWVFLGYKTENVPEQMMPLLRRARLRCCGTGMSSLLLAGHPKPEDLAEGRRMSKAPHDPVSRWNVLCDDLCNEVKANWKGGAS